MATWVNEPARRAQSMRMGASAQLLFDWLAMQSMAVTVNTPEELDALHTLLAAGFVRAYIRPRIFNAASHRFEQAAAVVSGITPEGRRWRAQL